MTDAKHLRILAISGSLRRGSFNSSLVRAAQALAPDGMTLDIYGGLRDLPHYDADLDTGDGPEPVRALKSAIAASDGVFISTPEYNYGIPGVLKNAIDWASRPGYKSVFAGKAVAIVSASPGGIGGARAQGQLKQVLLGMVAEVFPYPELAVSAAATRFAEDGTLTDDRTSAMLREMLVRFGGWVRARLQAAGG